MFVPPFEFVVVIALEMEKACELIVLISAQQIQIMILWMIPAVKFDTPILSDWRRSLVCSGFHIIG